MILTLAWRTLTAHPVRSLVLGCGFGFGVAVMATLLGVGEVVLEQARAPALAGGGDVLVSSLSGEMTSARFVQSAILGSSFADRVRAASPSARRALYLKKDERVVQISARGGVPSLERVLQDPETSGVAAWMDAPADKTWTRPDPGDVLRAMDRFHPIPDVPARADSWAEWLYFNGRAGETRFYVTFLVGRFRSDGRRMASVHLQLQRGDEQTSYSVQETVDGTAVLASAPDLTIGANSVRLEQARYVIALDLPLTTAGRTGRRSDRATRAVGELTIAPIAGRAVPPISIRGADGWVTGYTVPAMSAALTGSLRIGTERISLDGGSAYHDHNWGFWRGVSWRWGQVQHDGLSFVYGRVFAPPDAADPNRIPGFLAAIGPDGPIAYTTRVTIEESTLAGRSAPARILVRARGDALDVTLDLGVESAIVTPMRDGGFGGGLDFYQLRAQYRVTGRIAGRAIAFEAPGSAETFRGPEQ